MAIKTTFSIILFLILYACDCSDIDEFGRRVTVEIPIRSFPVQTIFSVGDTIWWEADFSDQVQVEGVERRMNLKNFKFFPDFVFHHVPLDPELVDSAIDIISETGNVTLISSDEVLYYGMNLVETAERYKLKFATILRKPGIFTAAVNTIIDFDEVDHPALYMCGKTRRDDFSIRYTNSSTNLNTYDSLFIPNLSNPDIINGFTFERYAQVGSITFVVNE